MARKQDEKNLLMEDELAAAFLNDDDLVTSDTSAPAPVAEDNWEDEADDLMGQLAVDVFETEEELDELWNIFQQLYYEDEEEEDGEEE